MNYEIIPMITDYGLQFFLVVNDGVVGMYPSREKAEEDAAEILPAA